MKIPFAKVVCDGHELNYVQEVLASGWLTTAGKTLEFERRFAEAVGARHACAVNSCTAALHLALEAIGIGPGDKVLVPTLTFTATAEVIRYLGADPVFADVEYGTGLLTPEIVEAALDQHPGIKAVVVVHFGGQAAQMTRESTPRRGTPHPASGHLLPSAEKGVSPVEAERVAQRTALSSQVGNTSALRTPPPSVPSLSAGGEGRGEVDSPLAFGLQGILEVCRHHGVKVIEDAAHAFPTRLDGRMVGSFGDVTCFSFYANKTITTGEGGMLVTEDEAIYRRAKVMRLHGIDRDIWNRFTSDKPAWEYDVVAPGFKYNLPDLAAAVGLAQLERAEPMRQERQRCFEFYLRELADCAGLDLPVIRSGDERQTPNTENVASALRIPHSSFLESHSCHLFWIVLKPEAPVSRNRFIELLAEAGIGTSVHYKPLHRMTYYRERYGLKAEHYPNAEKHWQGCVSLPVYPSLSNDELAYVVETVTETLKTNVERPTSNVEC